MTDSAAVPGWMTEALGWEGVARGRSRWGATDALSVDGREFAHLHGSSEVHVRLTAAGKREHRERLGASLRIRASSSRDWILVRCDDERSLPELREWVDLAYRANRA
ncbi:MAG: luciferase family protein [Thermoplasmata archaeon]